MIPLERVSGISDEDLINNYIKKHIPVIIEGKAKEWECCKSWSLDYFNELHGTDQVLYVDAQNKEKKGYVESSLAEVIEKIKNGEGEYYRFYPLLKKHPEHLLDFDYKWLRKCRTKGGVGEAFQVFIGGKGSYTPVHNANGHNLFTQVYGEKEWMLYPSHYTAIIDPDPARNVSRGAPKRKGLVFNPFEDVTEAHELYRYMDGYHVKLQPGDVLYNPPYWWHCVQNPSNSIGVGYRWFTPIKAFLGDPLYMFLDAFVFSPPIWKNWRNYEDFNLIQLAEAGKLKKISKEKGVRKLKDSVS